MLVYIDRVLGTTGTLRPLSDLVLERTNEHRYYELLLRNPSQFRLYAPSLAYVYALDELDQSASDTLSFAINQESTWSKERKPCQLMDLSHVCKLSEQGERSPDMRTLIELSNQYNPPDIIESTLKMAYELTHNIFFWHHFGVDHPAYPSVPAPENANDRYPGLLLRYLADENYDIALELLLSGVLQRTLSPVTVQLVLEEVTGVINEHGYVPGPQLDDDGVSGGDTLDDELNIDETDHLDEEVTSWRQHYHTTLVAAVVSRVLRAEWDDFVAETQREDHDCSYGELISLGHVLRVFGDYDLEEGSQRLIEISDSRVSDAFPIAFTSAISFLERQRNQRGKYGYWTDERLLFTSKGSRAESFDEDLVAPVSELCETAIREATRSHEHRH
nr:hypothetical protein [Halovivax sp. TS33]